MLVFAMSCNHAQAVTKQLNVLAGEGPFADWIGVPRTAAENEAILAEYNAHRLPCLVQIDKASEGFDNDRCSVLLFLHLIKSDTKLIQQIGRGLRRNHALDYEEDDVDIFASADTELARILQALEAANSWDEKTKRERESGDRLWDIPDLVMLNATFDYKQIVRPQRITDLDDELAARVRMWCTRMGITEPSPEQIQELVDLFRFNRAKTPEEPAPPTEAERLRGMQKKVSTAVRKLGGNIVNVACSGTFNNNVLVSAITGIHKRWIQQTGLKTNAMTAEDMAKKYAWVQELNAALKAEGQVPSWLNL